jgi:hypothetical protein
VLPVGDTSFVVDDDGLNEPAAPPARPVAGYFCVTETPPAATAAVGAACVTDASSISSRKPSDVSDAASVLPSPAARLRSHSSSDAMLVTALDVVTCGGVDEQTEDG